MTWTNRRMVAAVAFLVVVVSAAVGALGQAQPVDIGSRLELFVDHYLIERMEGAQLQLHRPVDRGVVFKFDQPWEGIFSAYVSVLRDDDRYLLYYRGMPSAGHGKGQEVLCYAESKDGVHWTRPQVGLVAHAGSKQNNILIGGSAAGTHSFGPFIDTKPGVPPAERFKALSPMSYTNKAGKKETTLAGFVSADGIHWRKLQDGPVIVNDTDHFAFDSQNVAFWSASEQKYVAYGRTWKGVRRISRWTSDDFVNWSRSTLMRYRHRGEDAPIEHMYTNQTHPYYRAPHIYIATAARFMPGRQVLTEAEAKAIDVHPRYFRDTSDAVLLTSRGGDVYERTFLSALVRPGIGARNWVSRTNYPALNVVPTGEHEMSIYVNQDYGQPTAHLRRYTLRPDGFASVRGDYSGGEMVTRPLRFAGDRLRVNFATSAAGSLRVEIQDAAGKPVPGFELAKSRVLIGNEIVRQAGWEGGADVGKLAGQVVRLRFVLKDADLYALQFVAAEGDKSP